MSWHHGERGVGASVGVAMDGRKGNQRLPRAAFTDDRSGSRLLPATHYPHGG